MIFRVHRTNRNPRHSFGEQPLHDSLLVNHSLGGHVHLALDVKFLFSDPYAGCTEIPERIHAIGYVGNSVGVSARLRSIWLGLAANQ